MVRPGEQSASFSSSHSRRPYNHGKPPLREPFVSSGYASVRDVAVLQQATQLILASTDLETVLHQALLVVRTYFGASRCRSEERRVGKECRSRWWACHCRETR